MRPLCSNSHSPFLYDADNTTVAIDTVASIMYFASVNANMSPVKDQEQAQETRINVSVPAELHRRLKAALALQGKSLRQWVIESAEETIHGESLIKSRKQ